jgi:DNA modification methylase
MANRIEVWPLGRLVPYEKNSRTHSDEQILQIAQSILQFGFTQPILVDEASDGILAGHGRLKAARHLGLAEVPVIPLGHLSEAEKRAYIIADNKLAENAGWDEKILKEEMRDLMASDFDLSVTGFSDKELEEILDDSGEALPGETEADDAPALAQEPVARTGDLWLLGAHRVLVGDAINSDDVDVLMDGDLANLVVTDPPYNVGYEGRTDEALVVPNDQLSVAAFQDFIDAACRNMRVHMLTNASLYIFYASAWHTAVEAAVESAGLEVRNQIIWAKNHFSFGFDRYKWQHEPILYCHVRGEADQWYGDKAQATLWWERKPTANREHPTMKPVELIERMLVNSSRRNDVVLDLFGGSGSTLIACERMGRKARVMEMEPRYADVILRRWLDHTKRQPILAAGGSTFLQIERERLVLERHVSSGEGAPAPEDDQAAARSKKKRSHRKKPEAA